MEMIDRVIDLLQQMYEKYAEIYSLSEKKKEQITQGDAQAMNETAKEEAAILSRITELEEEREKLVREYFQKNGKLTEVPATIEDLEELADEQQKQKLRELALQLREMLEKQKQINQENQTLIRLHLEYTNYMVNTFLREPQISNIYGNTGTVDENDPNESIIDNQA